MQDKQNQSVKSAQAAENIFHTSGKAIARFAAGQRLNFLKKAYKRNKESYYDESLFGTWAFLLLMSAVTAAGGGYYHYNIFETAFGMAGIAVAGSFMLFVLAEFCLVWFGLNWLRGIYNGVWKQTWADFGIFIGISIIVIAAALWDYDINARAVSAINSTIKNIEIKETPFNPPPSIAVYEQKIKAAEDAIKIAQSSTWKGRPTGQGLDVQKSNTDLIAQLEQQKSTTLSIARAEHDSLQLVQQLLVTGTAHQLADYGRYAVLAKFLFILLIPLFEIKNYKVSTLREVSEMVEDPGVEVAEEIRETKADLDHMQPVEEVSGMGFSAIYNRLRGKTADHPSPTATKKRGSTVATTSTASTGHKRPHFEDVEVGGRPHPKPDPVEDVESMLLTICGKWGKEYPSRWTNRVESGGKLHTMASKFTKWYKEINDLLEGPHAGVTKSTMAKVAGCRKAYEKDIYPTIQKLIQ